ncbi:MAG: DNA primase [Gammaproteobacteria bacterium]|nr:DNA primase [Gammaproteobacteria bacterium]
MPGRIPQSFIEDLLARTDIVDVIDGLVPLRKAGKNWQALCPFHDEKSPSFTVSQDKQFYHCFGCGVNGTAISFLMEYSNMGFVEAVESLAARAGLDVPREGGGPVRSEAGLGEIHELLELVIEYYRRQLKEHPQAARAVEYLRSRGLTGDLAARFEIGYAPPGWDNLITALGRSDAALQRLLKAGMLIQREGGGYYDRFRDRIMYPIRDHRGRAVGFGGRVMDESTPKYLNSPETPVFHKGRELYGLHQLRGANPARLIVVEGYMDALALAQFGITGAVATLGTAATREHLERMFRITPRIIFCFDGDDAGTRAGWRALETALPLLRDGRQVYFLFLPEDEDPDTHVRRHGPGTFEEEGRLVPLSDHLINTLKEGVDLNTREGRARFVDRAAPHLGALPTGALRQLLIQDIARLAGTGPEQIDPLLRRPKSRATPRRQAQRRGTQTGRPNPVLLGSIIRMLLFRPALAQLVPETGSFRTGAPGEVFLAELLDFVHSRPNISCAGIVENWRDSPFESRLRELSSIRDDAELEGLDLEREFADAMAALHEQKSRLERRSQLQGKGLKDLSEDERQQLRNRKPRGGSIRK